MKIKKRLTSCIGAVVAASLLLVCAAVLSGWNEPQEQPPNVLFIAVDDLRALSLGEGASQMHTPNIDRLAEGGVRFTRHYVQYPSCGPSRYALLTGQRPDMSFSNVFNGGNNEAFKVFMPHTQDGQHPVSLPDHFQRSGYYTVSIGKISHSPDGRWHEKTTRPGSVDDPEAPHQVPFSWDEVYGPRGPWETAWRSFFAYAGGKSRNRGETPAYEAAEVPDTGYPDGRIAEAAVQELQDFSDRDEPFFLAVGFYKPHLPFTAPQRYWDLYERGDIALAPYRKKPKQVDAPNLSWSASGELTGGYGGLPSSGDEITDEMARTLRHAYFAAVSYADAQVGKVLDALEEQGLRENTIVVLWGDHGWHLGDADVWGKHTPYEYALRSPLIFRVPGMEAAGEAAQGLAETVDVYPTLSDLCGLPIPERMVDGQSLVPLLEDPSRSAEGSAFSYYGSQDRWAKSMRTDRYRLIRWADRSNKTLQLELYDHREDPNETTNVAAESPELVKELLARMKADDDALTIP